MMPRLEKLFQIAAHVPRLEPSAQPTGLSTAAASAVVADAQRIALDRQGKLNSELTAAEVQRLARVSGMTGHVLRIARTIADLDGGRSITRADLDEAQSLGVARAFDR